MQFWTVEQCRAWMRDRPFDGGDWPTMRSEDLPLTSGKVGFAYGDAFRLASLFLDGNHTLLWVGDTEIWSANLHLYYRFRESYGDRRLVEDAPGHFFLRHEKADLLSFIQILLQNGWDFWVLEPEDYARLFVSHDEWFEALVVNEESRVHLAHVGPS